MQRNRLLVGIAVVFVLFMFVSFADGSIEASAQGNNCGIARNSLTGLHGNSFYVSNKPMNSYWNSGNNKYNFILHTTWVGFSGGEWIEVGMMDGAIRPPGGALGYWKGVYTATLDNGVYREYKVPGYSTNIDAGHHYQIIRGNSIGVKYKWDVYVDYKLVQSFTRSSVGCFWPDVGLETNCSVSTSSRWNERSMQTIRDYVWTNWQRSNVSIFQNGGSRAQFENSTSGNRIYTWR